MRELRILLRKLKAHDAGHATIQPALWTTGRFLGKAGDTRIVLEALEADLLHGAGASRLLEGTMEMPFPR